jgi:hypothetical protein
MRLCLRSPNIMNLNTNQIAHAVYSGGQHDCTTDVRRGTATARVVSLTGKQKEWRGATLRRSLPNAI